MTPLAVLFMTISVSAVVGLAAWCYYRVLTGNGKTPETDAESSDRERSAEP